MNKKKTVVYAVIKPTLYVSAFDLVGTNNNNNNTNLGFIYFVTIVPIILGLILIALIIGTIIFVVKKKQKETGFTVFLI